MAKLVRELPYHPQLCRAGRPGGGSPSIAEDILDDVGSGSGGSSHRGECYWRNWEIDVIRKLGNWEIGVMRILGNWEIGDKEIGELGNWCYKEIGKLGNWCCKKIGELGNYRRN